MSDLAAELGFDPSLKKKKKSKSKDETEAPVQATDDDLFAGLKKKKKSKSKETEGTEGTPEVDDLADALGDLKLKKKKKKSTKDSTVDSFEKELEKAGVLDTEEIAETPEPEQEQLQESVGLPYADLLSRFFGILRANNPDLVAGGNKFKIPPPIVQREGSKKTMFANVQEIADKLQRSPEHLTQFLFSEMGTSGSVDGEKRLIIKGRFQPKQIESILRRYILEYVTCKTCKSINTELKKESANRLMFLVCKSCGSTRSVSSIKSGYQAIIKRKRV